MTEHTTASPELDGIDLAELLTSAETAQRLNITKNNLKQYVFLKAIKPALRTRRGLLFAPSEVDRFASFRQRGAGRPRKHCDCKCHAARHRYTYISTATGLCKLCRHKWHAPDPA
jgi:hypothetical protein